MRSYGRRPNPVFSQEYAALREVVIEARHRAGLSQAELASRLGKAKSHVGMIERGQRRIDSLELYQMAKCLRVEPTDLFAAVSQRLDELAARET